MSRSGGGCSSTRAVLMQAQLRGGGARGAPDPTKKLDKEAMDKSLERLYRQFRRPKELGPLVETTVLPKAQVDESIHRLYNLAMDKKKNMRDAHQKKFLSQEPSKKLQPEELSENITKVYTQAIAGQDNMRKSLKKKYHAQADTKKLQPEEEAKCNTRLFSEPLEKRREKIERLQHQYLDQSLPTFPKLSAAQRNAAAERLYAGAQG